MNLCDFCQDSFFNPWYLLMCCFVVVVDLMFTFGHKCFLDGTSLDLLDVITTRAAMR